MWGYCDNYRSHIACRVTVCPEYWHCPRLVSASAACHLCQAGTGPQPSAMGREASQIFDNISVLDLTEFTNY